MSPPGYRMPDTIALPVKRPWWQRLLCWLGSHQWQYNWSRFHIHTGSGFRCSQCCVRNCLRCKVRQTLQADSESLGYVWDDER